MLVMALLFFPFVYDGGRVHAALCFYVFMFFVLFSEPFTWRSSCDTSISRELFGKERGREGKSLDGSRLCYALFRGLFFIYELRFTITFI